MADSTYEEATRCPKCGLPGEARLKQPAPPAASLPQGTMLHHIYCVTTMCEWYNTPWLVQVNADGSVPPPKDHTFSPKTIVGNEGDLEYATRLLAQLQATQEASTRPGSELRNPHS